MHKSQKKNRSQGLATEGHNGIPKIPLQFARHYGKQAKKIKWEMAEEGVTLNTSERFHTTDLIPTQGSSYFLLITLSPLRQALTQRMSGPLFFYISFCQHV